METPELEKYHDHSLMTTKEYHYVKICTMHRQLSNAL